MRNKFDDMLDQITELSNADQMRIQARLERLEPSCSASCWRWWKKRSPEEEDDGPEAH